MVTYTVKKVLKRTTRKPVTTSAIWLMCYIHIHLSSYNGFLGKQTQRLLLLVTNNVLVLLCLRDSRTGDSYDAMLVANKCCNVNLRNFGQILIFQGVFRYDTIYEMGCRCKCKDDQSLVFNWKKKKDFNSKSHWAWARFHSVLNGEYYAGEITQNIIAAWIENLLFYFILYVILILFIYFFVCCYIVFF